MTSTQQTPQTPSIIVATVCGECEEQVAATHRPDACFACGTIDGPWVLVRMRTEVDGGAIGMDLRFQLAGQWSESARAQARAELGTRLLGEA